MVNLIEGFSNRRRPSTFIFTMWEHRMFDNLIIFNVAKFTVDSVIVTNFV
jgi:hypothetical protein